MNRKPEHLNTSPAPIKHRISKEKIGFISCLLLAATFLLFPGTAVTFAASISDYAIKEYGLGFIVFPSLLVILSLLIAFTPFGKVRLGGWDEKPEFGFISWTAMLFAAGMGSGLIFWGVAEPIVHFAHPPSFVADTPLTSNVEDAKDTALALTYFHWGVHAWAVYAISGLVMAWFAFNRGRAMTISASFTDKAKGGRFQVFDFLAVIAVIFGVAGTLANTIALVQSGLQQVLPWDIAGLIFRLVLLMAIALAFTLSSTLGLDRGIKQMSLFNLLFVIAILLVVVSIVDPFAVAETLVTSTVSYISLLPSLSFTIDPSSRAWSEGWSIIYFVWWIAWAPFVGPFIARISKGRTVRQYLLCTIFVPTLTTIVWFSAFGGSVFEMSILDDVIAATNSDVTYGLFTFFDAIPYGKILTYSAILLLVTFVITSADSAIYVSGMLTGSSQLGSKLMWSLTLVAITIALLLKNDIELNKQIAILGAVPFTLILMAQTCILLKEMFNHKRVVDSDE
ncbi:BCCT family transporter [Shewanella woodyi]|uniref:BCCT transporter n=1 Tax=Shewanella woodyi (strain ATCC 51908 / MS32) TaxID=392500 RepID=B1KIZ5_SHEWM|nr:BCCT family transporter [Shewanella woodyi]ACA85643.1 BCCT transporter [Shewanella woodyi ATCC 51908]